jgi:hypothetical protein
MQQAPEIDGRRAIWRIVLDSPGDVEGAHHVYQCAGKDAVLRTVWLAAEQGDEPAEVIVADAVLHVIHHKEKITATGERFEGFTEYRLREERPRAAHGSQMTDQPPGFAPLQASGFSGCEGQSSARKGPAAEGQHRTRFPGPRFVQGLWQGVG